MQLRASVPSIERYHRRRLWKHLSVYEPKFVPPEMRRSLSRVVPKEKFHYIDIEIRSVAIGQLNVEIFLSLPTVVVYSITHCASISSRLG